MEISTTLASAVRPERCQAEREELADGKGKGGLRGVIGTRAHVCRPCGVQELWDCGQVASLLEPQFPVL